ncbi:uncharacterized protein LOC117644517 [Thrips palmi]|uniref:Uncharacterized protein LOC117644517 n=1 Tax=Thrips palmi TaxID=161013 RepID=A0A6P8Z072_THRPL|nr:uncharacterized protein LOC117644517 [Thrips palmi]
MRDQMLDTVSFLLRFLLICAAGSVIKVRASEVVEHSFRVNALTWGASSKAKWILLLHQLDTVRPTTTFGGLDVGLGLMLSVRKIFSPRGEQYCYKINFTQCHWTKFID